MEKGDSEIKGEKSQRAGTHAAPLDSRSAWAHVLKVEAKSPLQLKQHFVDCLS